MLFNSQEFLFFFSVVTALYFIFPHPARWALLLLASCLFYIAFIPVYIFILFITIVIDYAAGILIEKTEGPLRKVYLIASIVSICAVLFVFKYFNFFSVNVQALANFLHWNYPVGLLELVLPIGLSFHTFQSLSYVIELYRRNQKAERHFGIYSLYVMFYPQLVAGPIERPQNLLPQFYQAHHFEYERVTNGLKLMAWGVFKKVVIADRLAVFVTAVYDKPTEFQGISLITATVFFAFQIYCDFSGYSDIAIGAAQVMGFRLMENFRQPYLASSIAEFWRRWHISLSTWFRDYLYVSLGGNRVALSRWHLNIMLTFLLSGFWHGASWTFVIWGALHGFYFIVERGTENLRARISALTRLSRLPRLSHGLKVLTTFSLVAFAWIFFRAKNEQDAFYIATHLFSGVGSYLSHMFSNLFAVGTGKRIFEPVLLGQSKEEFMIAVSSIGLLMLVQWLQQREGVRLVLARQKAWLRWAAYYAIAFSILFFGIFERIRFIYFQF